MKETLHVFKIGGKVIDDDQELASFLKSFAAVGHHSGDSSAKGHKMLIHGGGKIATDVAERLGIKTQMIEGRRVTSQAMLEVVAMVYGGLVNKKIVARLQASGCNAVGLTGADMNCITASKRPVEPVDYGYVGDIQHVEPGVLAGLLQQDITPILAPMTHDGQGQLLNTNADAIASAAAVALAQSFDVKLYYCFEKPGVLTNIDDDASLIETLTYDKYQSLKQQGVIADGMIPKLDNAFYTMQQGVSQVCIMHHSQINHIEQQHLTATTLCL